MASAEANRSNPSESLLCGSCELPIDAVNGNVSVEVARHAADISLDRFSMDALVHPTALLSCDEKKRPATASDAPLASTPPSDCNWLKASSLLQQLSAMTGAVSIADDDAPDAVQCCSHEHFVDDDELQLAVDIMHEYRYVDEPPAGLSHTLPSRPLSACSSPIAPPDCCSATSSYDELYDVQTGVYHRHVPASPAQPDSSCDTSCPMSTPSFACDCRTSPHCCSPQCNGGATLGTLARAAAAPLDRPLSH